MSDLVTRSGILIQITRQCPNYTRRCILPYDRCAHSAESANSILRAICANLLDDTTDRPAVAPRPKIDSDPTGGDQCSSSQDTSVEDIIVDTRVGEKYLNHRQKRKPTTVVRGHWTCDCHYCHHHEMQTSCCVLERF